MKFRNGILFLIMGLFFIGCYPKKNHPLYQTYDYSQKYKDQVGEGNSIVDAGYNYLIEKTVDGEYIQKTFYPDTKQMTHFYTYADKTLSVVEGEVKEWWDDGSLNFEGQFEDNMRIGEWKDYSTTKAGTFSQGKYRSNRRDGLWTTKNKEGTLVAETTYRDGKKHGAYKIFSDDGRLLEKGVYENDVQKNRDVLDSETEPGGGIEKVIEVFPMFKGCETVADKKEQKSCAEEKMLRFIYSNIRYPAVPRQEGVQGRSIAQFVVDKTGKVKDIKIRRGICKEIKAEVTRVLKLMPEWNPGTQRGKPVKVVFTLPVAFKLQG